MNNSFSLAYFVCLCLALSAVANSYSREPRPVVIMHGLGEKYNDAFIERFISNFKAKLPGVYVTTIDVASGFLSVLEDMNLQTTMLYHHIRNDPKLSRGFNAIGISQGGLMMRTYIERYNDPAVYNFISLSGPQAGIGQCPNDKLRTLCEIMTANPYLDPLSEPSAVGYWVPINRKASFVMFNKFLADINNERPIKNMKYRENMISLNKYVIMMALNDTTVIPKESTHHGFWEWNNKGTLITMEETDGYKGDWIGLRTLNEANKIVKLSFEGVHCKVSEQFWSAHVMQYFYN